MLAIHKIKLIRVIYDALRTPNFHSQFSIRNSINSVMATFIPECVAVYTCNIKGPGHVILARNRNIVFLGGEMTRILKNN